MIRVFMGPWTVTRFGTLWRTTPIQLASLNPSTMKYLGLILQRNGKTLIIKKLKLIVANVLFIVLVHKDCKFLTPSLQRRISFVLIMIILTIFLTKKISFGSVNMGVNVELKFQRKENIKSLLIYLNNQQMDIII